MKRNVYVGVLLTALLMTSCINTKRIVYLEDMKESLSYPMNAQPFTESRTDGSFQYIDRRKLSGNFQWRCSYRYRYAKM